MKQLIEKMGADKMNVYFIGKWYEEMLHYFEECRSLRENGQKCMDSAAFMLGKELYDRLVGFLFGLFSVGYITSEHFDVCTGELFEFLQF